MRNVTVEPLTQEIMQEALAQDDTLVTLPQAATMLSVDYNKLYSIIARNRRTRLSTGYRQAHDRFGPRPAVRFRLSDIIVAARKAGLIQ